MKLREMLAANAWLKALSFGISVLLWIFVQAEQKAEAVLRIPVRLLNIPEKLVVVGDPVPEVQVVVDGPRTLVAQAARSTIAYSVDLGEMDSGSQQVRIRPDRIGLPRGVEVVRIVPSILDIELRRVETRRLPVQARLSGDLAPGYEIVGVEIEPELLELSAAAGDLTQLKILHTEPLNIQDRASDWSGMVPLDLDGLNIKSITTREVDVFLRVAQRMGERTLGGVPLQVRGGNGRLVATPETVTVRVMGPEPLIAKLAPGELSAYIDGNASGRRQPVRLELPPEVVLLEVRPTEASLLLGR